VERRKDRVVFLVFVNFLGILPVMIRDQRDQQPLYFLSDFQVDPHGINEHE